MVRSLFLLIYASNYSIPGMCFVCNEQNCLKYLQKCKTSVHCLVHRRSSVSSGFCPSPVRAGFGARQRGKVGALWKKAGALDQCGSCVGVTLVRIMGRIGQNLPLRDSLSLGRCQVWLREAGEVLDRVVWIICHS